MTDANRTAFEAWATDYFGANVSYPEACFDAWQAAMSESICPECHCHFTATEVTAPGSTRLVNTAQPDHSEQHLEMIAAARAVVDRWDSPLWKDVPATAVYINRLRDALPAIGETME